MQQLPITTLFLDIGGVLLTNGWGRHSRRKAAVEFKLDFDEIDERHHLSFDAYETGKLSLDQYLDQVIFFEPRGFSPADFKAFMFAQSQPYPDMLQLMRDLKARHHLKIATVSNEGRELTYYRVKQFALTDIVDTFVVSSFVHFRKPDSDIYRVALDMVQSPADQVLYIDDRHLFIEVAGRLGFRCIHHTNIHSTIAQLADFGLTLT